MKIGSSQVIEPILKEKNKQGKSNSMDEDSSQRKHHHSPTTLFDVYS